MKGKKIAEKAFEGFRMQNRLKDDQKAPEYIFIIINNICNLRCKMCDIGQQNEESQFFQIMARKGRQLDIDTLKRLVDEVRSFRPTLAITSTEPLLFKDLFSFIEYVKLADLPVQITTNGFLLPLHASEIVKSKVDSLWISLDGPQDVHNLIRGNPYSFQKAVDGIRKVNAEKEKLNDDISINVNYSISNYNDSNLIGFLREIENLPLDSVSFSHLNYVTDEMASLHNRMYGRYCRATSSSIIAADPLKVDVSALNEQISIIKKNKWPFIISFSPDISGEKIEEFYRKPDIVVASETCRASFNIAQLASNGDWVVTTRCFSISLGNFFEEKFFSTWNGKKYKKFRSWISKIGLSPACTRCCGAL